jgi:integrase
MSAPKVAVVFYKYKTYSNGNHPVMIRITSNRKSSYLATGYAVKPENWDEQNNKLIETRSKLHPEKKPLSNAKAINSDIESKLNEVIIAKQQVAASDQSQASRLIKNKVNSKYTASGCFLKYGRYHSQLLQDRAKVRTSKNYNSVLKRLEDYQGTSLLFSDITVEFLNRYEAFLIKDGVSTNTVQYHFKTIRSILYKAMNESIPLFPQEKNPFFRFKIKTAKTKKETLSADEIKKISKAKLKLPEQQKLLNAQGYYLFSYYNAGIRISDLIQLKIENILNDRLYYAMGKTGHFKSIKLNEESKAILKRFKRKNAKPHDYLFPILDTGRVYSDAETLRRQIESKAAAINEALKGLAEVAKVNKRLHFHSSRHSFANMARKKKADLFSVSKALGHHSLKVTENYLESFDEEALDETMAMIFKK